MTDNTNGDMAITNSSDVVIWLEALYEAVDKVHPTYSIKNKTELIIIMFSPFVGREIYALANGDRFAKFVIQDNMIYALEWALRQQWPLKEFTREGMERIQALETFLPATRTLMFDLGEYTGTEVCWSDICEEDKLDLHALDIKLIENGCKDTGFIWDSSFFVEEPSMRKLMQGIIDFLKSE